jgi:predicted NAD/FAD-binding protein
LFVRAVVSSLSAPVQNIRTNCPIRSITRNGDDQAAKWTIVDHEGAATEFDAVVMATQANHGLKLLANPTTEQVEALQGFRHESTRLVLHTDTRVMPANRSSWTSINIVLDDKVDVPQATLWMNRNVPELKGSSVEYFQTTSPCIDIPKEKILHEYTFERPIMDSDALQSLKTLQRINGDHNLWFVGAYSTYNMPLLESGVRYMPPQTSFVDPFVVHSMC